MTVPAADVREFMAETSDEVYAHLFTFKATGEPDSYLVADVEDVVSNGKTYQAADFQFIPPDLTGDEISAPKVVFSNVSRELIGVIRSAHVGPTLTEALIAKSRPDDIIVERGPYSIEKVTFSLASITAEMAAHRKILGERFPYGQYIPSWFPGVFA